MIRTSETSSCSFYSESNFVPLKMFKNCPASKHQVSSELASLTISMVMTLFVVHMDPIWGIGVSITLKTSRACFMINSTLPFTKRPVKMLIHPFSKRSMKIFPNGIHHRPRICHICLQWRMLSTTIYHRGMYRL